MNEVIVKWLATGTIATVMCGALWMASSVQANAGGKPGRPLAAASHGKASLPSLRLAALPPQHAASGVLATRASAISVR